MASANKLTLDGSSAWSTHLSGGVNPLTKTRTRELVITRLPVEARSDRTVDTLPDVTKTILMIKNSPSTPFFNSSLETELFIQRSEYAKALSNISNPVELQLHSDLSLLNFEDGINPTHPRILRIANTFEGVVRNMTSRADSRLQKISIFGILQQASLDHETFYNLERNHFMTVTELNALWSYPGYHDIVRGLVRSLTHHPRESTTPKPMLHLSGLREQDRSQMISKFEYFRLNVSDHSDQILLLADAQ